jgi:putative transposase
MARYNPEYHHRRSIRLREYDYSQAGLYFVTICVYNRECFLGNIRQGAFLASPLGKIVQQSISELASSQPDIEIAAWVVMPNHLHFIVDIQHKSNITLGEIIRKFKYETTKQINIIRDSPGVKVWQRNYYEHIIRSDRAHKIIQEYIHKNPSKWKDDQLHPETPSKW